jgi:multiple sugar transport system ATP-binding protein
VRKPRLFLLDEPLSNLDAKLRLETRVELRKLQRALGVTAVYVTHDQEEAMTIADRVAVFMEGRIVQVGRPQDIFTRPASAIVAAFIGSPPMNLLPAEVRGQVLSVAGVDLPVDIALGAAGAVTLGVRPAALRIATTGLPARVYLVENLGDTTIVDLDVGGQVIKLRTDQPPGVREGDSVHVAFARDSLHIFERESGMRRKL